MPYSQAIDRNHPALLVFLLDQSQSMRRAWGSDSTRSLSQGTADAINHLLNDFIIKSTKTEGVRNYFDVAVLGYKGTSIESAISQKTLDQLPISITEMADIARIEERTQQVEDGTGGLVEKPVKIKAWIDPISEGNTPMCEALSKCYDLVSQWISVHQSSFPPIVINITDGEATDGDPEPNAERIKELGTSDGNVLLFNLHISPSSPKTLMYPRAQDEGTLPDEFAKRLFRMSSSLPEIYVNNLTTDGYLVEGSSRGFVFNAGLVELINAVDVGTKTALYHVEAG